MPIFNLKIFIYINLSHIASKKDIILKDSTILLKDSQTLFLLFTAYREIFCKLVIVLSGPYLKFFRDAILHGHFSLQTMVTHW